MKRSPMPRPTKPLRRFTELRRTRRSEAGTSVGAAPAGGKVAPAASRPRVGRSRFLPDAAAIIHARAGGVCEIQLAGCWGRATEKHHRITQKVGGRHRQGKRRSDRPSNALHSCSWCHQVITNRPWQVDAKDAGWVLQEWQEPTQVPVLYRHDWVYLDDAGGCWPHREAAARTGRIGGRGCVMVVLDVICRVRTHESEQARRYGCVCPVAWGEPFQRPAPQRRYVRGRIQNRRGPHRSTVQELDEIAVERWAGGDRSLTLAARERDAAIDRLDRYGRSASEIAERLGITQRTVQRRRAARRKEAVM